MFAGKAKFRKAWKTLAAHCFVLSARRRNAQSHITINSIAARAINTPASSQKCSQKEKQRKLSRRPKLQRRQLRIGAAFCDQFVMLADFDNAALVEHDDAVGFLDGG
jgi:NAD(P)-dependent dehydrogenase (short-subunit alcohol dehydrogenase family)